MAKKVYKTSRKFHCPYCGALYPRMDLIDHVNKEHESLIPEGYSATRVVYEAINKTDHGTCMICKKNVYEWNEKTSRYNNLCDNPKCREEVRRIALERHVRVYNKPSLLDDPEHQEKMLGNRRISGKYRHSDGAELTYTGRYEKAAVEFMDKVMNIPSKDIQMPGPVLEYEFEGETHHWITDIYYIPANLIIEVKDGGDNPNKRNMPVYRGKQAAKEVMITNLGKFNYLRLTNNNFSQLLETLADIKYENLDQKEATQVKYYINESTRLELLREDKSELDKDFKPKENIKLSSLKRVHITESIIDKYKKEYPVLRHVRCKDTKEYVCDGYMWFDGDNLVCYVGSCEYLDDHTKWIVSLEIMPEYKGHGLSKQIVDFAVKSMGCKYLSVNKNNKIAKHVYDKYGFKSYQNDDHMNYMTIDNSRVFNESGIINEKVLRNTEDIYWNKDKFDSGEINLCFITGLSGSGKSTMGRDMQKDGIEHYELDDVCTNWNFSDDNLKEYGDLIYSFFKGPGKKYRYRSTDEFIEDKEWDGKDGKNDGYEPCVIREFIKYTISYAKSHKDTKFVLEGVWMFLFFEPSYFKEYAFYIKGTSMIISNIRGAKRDVGNQIDKDEHPIKYRAKLFMNINRHWLYYIKDELKIRKFVDYYSKLVKSMNESSTTSTKLYRISESSSWDGAVITPRVPKNFLTDNGYEDNKTPRVCFSTSINGCLRAMSANLKDKEFYVFIPDGKYVFYRPSTKEVPDQLVTNEVWIKEDVKLKMIGKIHVSEAKDKPLGYNYGTDKYAELYDWKWSWEEKIKEEVGGIPASSGRYSTFIIPYMLHNTFDIAIGCDRDDEVLVTDNGSLELRDLSAFEDEYHPSQIMVYDDDDAVMKFENIKYNCNSIKDALKVLTGHEIHHIDELMLCENLKLRDFDKEDASLDMIYKGVIRENQILSGAIKVHDNPTAIKGHVILAKTMDGGCFIHTPNDYYLSSDIYPTPEDIPQNVIDTMEDLYVSNRKETE